MSKASKEELITNPKEIKQEENKIRQEKPKKELTKEEKKQIKKENKNKKLPKEISQEILKKIFKNLLIAGAILIYFAILNIAYAKMEEERLVNDLKAFAGFFLAFGIFFLEKGYKNDDGTNAIYGIESIVLSGHTLSIMHIITMYKYNFQLYLLASSYIFAIYFVLKSIVLYTRGKQQYWLSLSDISEIVKDEPQKKEALKREDSKFIIKENKKRTIKPKNTQKNREKEEKNIEKATKEENVKIPKKETKKSKDLTTTKKEPIKKKEETTKVESSSKPKKVIKTEKEETTKKEAKRKPRKT